MDFQWLVRAAKIVFSSYPVWKTSLFTERSLLMLHAFAFRLFFPKRKALADIHRNVGLIHLVMRRSSNCSKPVIIWTLGHLGPGHTTAKTMTTVTVTFTATAKKAVNRSHTKLPFFTLVSNLLRTSFSLYISGLFSSSETYAFRRMVATASFFFLVIPVNS